MQEFKQQTICLLKEQVNQLKIVHKEIKIKDEQILFLKETILNLEDQKQCMLEQLNDARSKLKTMYHEVSTYNSTVVSRVHQDNTHLAQELQQIRQQLTSNVQTIQRLTTNLAKLQETNNKLQEELNQKQQEVSSKTNQGLKLKSKLDNYQTTNKQLREKEMKLTMKNDQLSNQIKNLAQQIDMLTQKSQESINITEKKIKNAIDSMVSKEKYNHLEQKNLQFEKILSEKLQIVKKLEREKQKLAFQRNSQRQMAINSESRFQILRSKIDKDISNLKQSIGFGKKIVEFQSVHSATLDQIYENCSMHKLQNKQMKQLINYHNQELQRHKKDIWLYKSQIEQLQTENQLCKASYKQQLSAIQSQHEGKVIQLSLKLKKEQRAIKKLSIKQRQLESLSKQLKTLTNQHQSLKQSSGRTIQVIKKQNNKLIQEVQDMAELCESNIQAKNSLNKVKYILNDLASTIYYLHQVNMRHKQGIRKIYMPFVLNYLKHYDSKKSSKKKWLLSKFRSAGFAIMAIERMKANSRNNQKIGSGVVRYTAKAIKDRNKIGNISGLVERIMAQCLKENTNTPNIVELARNTYRWNLPNYDKVVLKGHHENK